MNCPSCGHDNRETARFCDACASSLAPSCSSCGAELRAAARFCDQCAAPVSPRSDGPLATERDPRSYTPKHLVDKILQSKSAVELAAARGDDAGRAAHVREAQRIYAELGATGHAARVASELATCS